MKDSKKKFIQIFALALIMLLIASATYAFFSAQTNGSSITDMIVTTGTTDNLIFETGDAISIHANQDNFGEGDGNQSGSTYASVTLVANNDTNYATANYYVYLHISENTFSYTTDDSTPEILLNVYDPDGNKITSLDGLNYTTVTDGAGNEISGFDITTYSGILTIAEYYEIISKGSNTQEWNITVTLVNLDSNQADNTGASFSAKLLIQSTVYGNTLQAVGGSSYTDEIWAYKSSITSIVFDDSGSTISDYTEVYDVSDASDGSIHAYLVDNSTLSMLNNSIVTKTSYDNTIAASTTYTVYIVSNLPILGNVDMSYWFYNFKVLETIEGLEKLVTSNVTSMSYMFYYCSKLTSLDLSSFDTSKVTNMSSMFYYCSKLTSLDLSSFDTLEVTNMSSMFSGCSSLTSLDLSSFDTSKVTRMSYMFFRCNSLTSLDLSSFDTSKVESMMDMFADNSAASMKLEEIIFGESWDTSNVTNMIDMFYNCSSLTTLDLSSFDTSKVTHMEHMFINCSSLKTLDLSNFDTSSVTMMNSMFSGCSSLTSLDLSGWDTSNVTYMSSMFENCSSLTSLDLNNFDTSNVTTMSYMFYNCYGLTSLDLSSFDTSNVKDMSYMSYNCSSLTSLDLNNFDTSNVTTMSYMFYNCSSLTTLDLSNADFSNTTAYSYMFRYNNSSITITVKDSDAYDFISTRLSEYNGGTVVIA